MVYPPFLKKLQQNSHFVFFVNTSNTLLQKGLVSVFLFFRFFFSYSKNNIVAWSLEFEKHKNILVKFFMMKRGRYSRPFLHITAMVVVAIGVLIGPLLADTYPIFSNNPSLSAKIQAQEISKQSITVGENVFQTDISQKPRDKVLSYIVQKGDTLSTIAVKFGISTDTIKWENNLTNDDITVGDEIKILPVSGVEHKVAKGETVYSIAKTFSTDPQKIVDFPFNEFANPETFSLVEGEMLIVPDGVPPTEPAPVKQPTYIAQLPSTPGQVYASGISWPVHGIITQFASWYHMALDIAAPYGTPILAAQNGTVVRVSTGTYDLGFGNNVYIQNGDIKTHYAHMSAVNVSLGQTVTAGQTVVGWIGLTGRTTGPHVHFEILRNGTLVDPMPYLQ